MSDQDPVTKALENLGIDPTEVDPEVLESLRDAAEAAIPPERHVRQILEAEARGEPVSGRAFMDAANVGVPYRPLRNAATMVRGLYRTRGGETAAAYAAEATAEVLAEMTGTGEPDPVSPADLAAVIDGWDY